MDFSLTKTWTINSQILCGVSFFILLANIIEITLILKERGRWRNAQILLFNLALVDAALGLTTIISTSIFLFNHIRITILTAILGLVFFGNMCGSSFIVVLISADRWVAVKWPLQYRILMTKRRLHFAILVAWVLSILILSSIIALGEVEKDYTVRFSIMGSIMIIETLILVYLYCSIFVSYRKSAKATVTDSKALNNLKRSEVKIQRVQRQEKACKPDEKHIISFSKLSSASLESRNYNCYKSEQRSSEGSRLMQLTDREKRLLKFCIAIVVSFFLSNVPVAVALFIVRSLGKQTPSWLQVLTTVTLLSGSLWNPFLYFLHQFCCKRKA